MMEFVDVVNELQVAIEQHNEQFTIRAVSSLESLPQISVRELVILRALCIRMLFRLAPVADLAVQSKLIAGILDAADLFTLRKAVRRWHLFARTDQRTDRRVATVLAQIDKNYADRESVVLSTLSRLVKLSPTYLSRLIRRDTGEGLVSHIRKRRASKALELMHNTDWPLRDIARRIGYGHEADLCRDFRRVFGKSPRRYARGVGPSD